VEVVGLQYVGFCEDAMRRTKARLDLPSFSFVQTCNRRRLANDPDIVLYTF